MQRQVRQLIVVGAVAFAAAASAGEQAPARVEKAQYVLALSGGKEVRAGAPATIELVLSARAGYHINADYPSSFRTDTTAGGVRYPQPKLDKSSGFALEPCPGASEACQAHLGVPFVIDRPGTHSVGGTLAFCVCNADECLIEKVTVALPVTAS
jgi:hypothetical protein